MDGRGEVGYCFLQQAVKAGEHTREQYYGSGVWSIYALCIYIVRRVSIFGSSESDLL